MNATEHKKLSEVRKSLIKTGLFCFERDGTFFLYREVRDARNTKVLHSKDIDDFVRRVNKVITK